MSGLHPALVVTLARPGKAGLEQVVADQLRQEALGQLPLQAHPTFDRRRQIVVDQTCRYPTEPGERPHMTIEKRQLIAAVVQPHEVAA
jgi:hypothetical protein